MCFKKTVSHADKISIYAQIKRTIAHICVRITREKCVETSVQLLSIRQKLNKATDLSSLHMCFYMGVHSQSNKSKRPAEHAIGAKDRSTYLL